MNSGRGEKRKAPRHAVGVVDDGLAVGDVRSSMSVAHERDAGAVTAAQMRRIVSLVPQGTKRSIRSSLLVLVGPPRSKPCR